MSKSTFKELVKKRIRKGNTAVDNDLSSDEEKWLDDFDAEMQETNPVNLTILTRRQLIYHVIKLENTEERKKLIEDYEIKAEELKELRKYVTSSGKLNPGLLSGLKNYNINSSSSSSSVSSSSSNLRRLIENLTPAHSTHASTTTLSSFPSTSQCTLSGTTSTSKKTGKNKAKQIKSSDNTCLKLQDAEHSSLEIKHLSEEQCILNLEKELPIEERTSIEEYRRYLEDDVLSLEGNSSPRTTISRDSSSSKDRFITYDEESSRIIKRIRTSSTQTDRSFTKKSSNHKGRKIKTGHEIASSVPGKSSNHKGKKIKTGHGRASSIPGKSSNHKGKKIKTSHERASSVPGKSSINTSERETEQVLKNTSKKRKDRCATPKSDDECSEYLPSDYEKNISTPTSSEGDSKTTAKKKSSRPKSSNVKRVTFQSPVSGNSSQVSSEMEELEKRFIRENRKFPLFPEKRVLRSSSSRSTKLDNNEKSEEKSEEKSLKTQKLILRGCITHKKKSSKHSSNKAKGERLRSLLTASNYELSCSYTLSSSRSVHSEKICQDSSEKSSIVSISSSCSCSQGSCSCSKNSSAEKGTSLISINSESTSVDGICLGESEKVGLVDNNIVNVCSPKSLADGASNLLKDDMPTSKPSSPKSSNINSPKIILSDVELSPVISSFHLRVAGKGLSDSSEAKIREPCHETFPDTSGSSSENLFKPFIVFTKDNPYIWNKRNKLRPFSRYLPKQGEPVSFHLLVGGCRYKIFSTPLFFTENSQRETTCMSSDESQDSESINSSYDEKDPKMFKDNQNKKRKISETKADKVIKPKIFKDDRNKKSTTETKPYYIGMTLRSGRTKLKPIMPLDQYETIVENASPQLPDSEPIQSSYDENEGHVESKHNPNQQMTGNKIKLNEGMVLRSGKMKPPVTELDQLIKLFNNILLIQENFEELIKSPEVPYVTLLSGQRKKFKSSNISKVVQRICSKKDGYKTKKIANKYKDRKLARQENLLNKNANTINILSTQATTFYNFGRDCIQMIKSSVAQPPRSPILCGMNCGKPKVYMCTTTGVFVCSLQCYRKNLEMCKKAVQDFVDENCIQIIESQSEQFPKVENKDEDHSA